MKFQYVSFLDNVVFPPLNELYIQGLSRYASSPINIYGSNFPSMHVHPILTAYKTTQLRRFFSQANSQSQNIQPGPTIPCINVD